MSRIVSRDRLSDYAHWDPPSMDPAPEQVAEAELPVPAAAEEAPPAMTLPSAEEIEAIRREAEEQGYAAGYQNGYAGGRQEGRQDGLAAARDEIAAEIERLRQIMEFMGQPLAELDAVVEEELVRLAIGIARQLVRRELKTAAGEIVAVVREAIGLLPVASQKVQVYLHPLDARLVREVLKLDEQTPSWRLVEEPTLTRGGCKVISEKSRIDATLEKRLGAVIAAVLGDERGDGLVEPS